MAISFTQHVRTQVIRVLYTVGLCLLISSRLSSDDPSRALVVLSFFSLIFFFSFTSPLSGRRYEGYVWLLTIAIYTLIFNRKLTQLGVLNSWIAFTYFTVGLTPMPKLDTWDGRYFELPEYEIVRELAGLLTSFLIFFWSSRDKNYPRASFWRHCAGAAALWLLLCCLWSIFVTLLFKNRRRARESLQEFIPSSISRRIGLVSTRIPAVASHQWMRLLAFCERAALSSQQQKLAGDVEFTYSGELSGSQIRLLIVEKRDFGSIPRCRLTTVPLVDAPVYVACSYVWGTSNSRQMILVEGKPMWISDSLYQVVRRQQSFKGPCTLWIDAICINQANLAEKSTQIGIMRHIFQAAERVDAFVEPNLKSLTQTSMLFLFRPDGEYGAATRFSGEGSPCWSQFREFIDKPWFNRVWILQEAAVSSSLNLINGDSELKWEAFMSGLLALCGTPDVQIQADPDVFRSLAQRLSSSGESVSEQLLQQVAFVESVRHQFQRNGEVPLWRLLRSSSRHQATKVHDKIFALLGLTKLDAADKIGINYAYDVRELYVRTMDYVLHQEENVSLISLATSPESIRGYDLPSWVPGWRNPLPTQLLPTCGRWHAAVNIPFEASELTRDGNSLSVRTRRVDRVTNIGLPVPFYENSVLSSREFAGFEPQFDLLGASRDFTTQAWHFLKVSPTRSYSSVESLRQAFRDTLVMQGSEPSASPSQSSFPSPSPSPFSDPNPDTISDTDFNPDTNTDTTNTPEDIFSSYEWAIDLYDDEQSPPFLVHKSQRFERDDQLATRFRKAEDFARKMFTDSSGRNFSITAQGRLAMLPPNVEVGDEIHLIPSGQAAFVLRSKELIDVDDDVVHDVVDDIDDGPGTSAGNPTSQRQTQTYTLIGYAYVHGLMNGELTKDDPWAGTGTGTGTKLGTRKMKGKGRVLGTATGSSSNSGSGPWRTSVIV